MAHQIGNITNIHRQHLPLGDAIVPSSQNMASLRTATNLLNDVTIAFQRMHNHHQYITTPIASAHTPDLTSVQAKMTNFGDDLLRLSQTVDVIHSTTKPLPTLVQCILNERTSSNETCSHMHRRLTSLEKNVDQLIQSAPRDPLAGSQPTWNVVATATWHGKRLVGATTTIQHVQDNTTTTISFDIVGSYAERIKYEKHRSDSPEATNAWAKAREAATTKAESWKIGEVKSVMTIQSPITHNPPKGLEPNTQDHPCACLNSMLRAMEPHNNQLVCMTRRLCQEMLLAFRYEMQSHNITTIRVLRIGSIQYD